jgi:hypothetical protein
LFLGITAFKKPTGMQIPVGSIFYKASVAGDGFDLAPGIT